ncbi:MAG TPA: polysaccharide lyase family 8 super-sandwich domain-containing protein [Armatimonadota bacterium]|nr:polysaccharide lyase family 8 super-sandwich domain-containing protein [Armatimonadota bacterium]
MWLDARPDNVAALDARVADLLARQLLDPAHACCGGWGDVTSVESPPLSFGGETFAQVLALAQAWALPASRYHRDAEVARRLTLAWRFYHQFVYAGCPFPNNWWAWQIGIPELLNATLLVAADAFPAEERATLLAAIRHLVDHIWDFHPGANAMWAAMVFAGYGLVAGDARYLALAATTVDRACELTDTQGILQDYSYSFHGRGLNMGYGTLHFNYIGRFTYLMGDSPWRMRDRTLSNAVNLLLDFVRWTIVGGQMDPFIIDRGISGGEATMTGKTDEVLAGALLLSTGPIPRREEVLDCCRWLLAQRPEVQNPLAAEIAAALPPGAITPLLGMRYWPESEHFVCRQPGWTAAVKMASEKNKCYFGINKTNLKGWHISDGHLVLRLRGDEYLEGVIPTMDWERLTGITRADRYKAAEETHGHAWFAGGATNADGTLGCVGIDFMLRHLDRTMLTARKSWFFLGDAIVALATEIGCDGDDPVETIIRHMPLPADQDIIEGEQELRTEFLESADCAYILPGAPKILVRTERRAGCWSDLRAETPLTPLLTKPYWTALIPHGRKPNKQSYVIVYLPGMTAAQARAWRATDPFTILQQDDLAHRVRDNRTGAVLTIRQWVGGSVEMPAEA